MFPRGLHAERLVGHTEVLLTCAGSTPHQKAHAERNAKERMLIPRKSGGLPQSSHRGSGAGQTPPLSVFTFAFGWFPKVPLLLVAVDRNWESPLTSPTSPAPHCSSGGESYFSQLFSDEGQVGG